MRSFACILVIFITLALVAVDAKIVFKDEFNTPFNPLAATSPYGWYYFDPYSTSIDLSTSRGKSTISFNPFTYTVPQGSLGTLDHVKGLTFIKTAYAPGPREGTVSGTATISAESYGVVDHPFPSQYVTNANDDVRLGSCSLNAIDPDNMIVADFFMTNEGLYAWYERLPFVRTNTNFYRAFSQAYRVGDRSPEDFHRLGVVYDKKCRSISWTLDDEVVFQVKMIGYLSHKPGVVTMVDLGGDETLVTPTRFQFGFGCFTLLDMNDYWNPSNQGLVQIGDNNAVEYYNPTNFWDTNSYGEDRLWGQGAHIRIDRFVVEVE